MLPGYKKAQSMVYCGIYPEMCIRDRDCFFEEDGGWVLLDYKTGSAADAAAGRDEKIAEKYRTQIELYRQALEAATGRKVKEAYLYMTDAGRFIKI